MPRRLEWSFRRALVAAGWGLAAALAGHARGQAIEGAGIQGKPSGGAPADTVKADVKAKSAPSTEETRDSLRGDVKRSVDFGFIRDPGASPTVDHRIKGTGISVPSCVGGTDGPDCK
jgi:hypothetical protein